MSTLFGYYGLGLSALRAAQTGIQVTGDNIANINTPGFGRRRLELEPGIPIPVYHSFLSNGVDITRVRRQQDALIQYNLEREMGQLAGEEERLRGLQSIEDALGSIQDEGLASRYAELSSRFTELAAAADDLSLRRAAIASADGLARQLATNYAQLAGQRSEEDAAIRRTTDEINRLAESLAELNRQIAGDEIEPDTAGPLRDERQQVVERLVELTGGSTVPDERGRLQFALPGGGTLVTSEHARPLTLQTAADGTALIDLDGFDVSGRVRAGRLGGLLALRDESLPGRLAELDALAADLIVRANALTTSAFDLDGNPGVGLFEPDPPPATGAAAQIRVAPALLADARKLAVSATGAPGDGTVATSIAALHQASSAALGNRSPEQFIVDLHADAGRAVAEGDVSVAIAQGLTASYAERRDQVSGVSLDEEAVNLIRYQRSYEAAARFMTVLNEISEITVNIGL